MKHVHAVHRSPTLNVCALISCGMIFMVFMDWKPSMKVYTHKNLN